MLAGVFRGKARADCSRQRAGRNAGKSGAWDVGPPRRLRRTWRPRTPSGGARREWARDSGSPGDGLLTGDTVGEGLVAPLDGGRPPDLDGQGPRHELEGLEPAGGAAGEGVDDLLEGRDVGAAVADDGILVDGGGRGGQRHRRLALAPHRGLQAGRGHRAHGGVEGGVVRLGDLSERREPGPLEGRLEVGREVAAGRTPAGAPGRTARSRAGPPGVPAAWRSPRRCGRRGATRPAPARRRGPGGAAARRGWSPPPAPGAGRRPGPA